MKLQECLKSFSVGGVGTEEIQGLYIQCGNQSYVRDLCKMLIEDEWTCELSTKLKLATLWLLKEKGTESRCLDVASKTLRWMMIMMLRGGTDPLMIESERL